MIRLGRLCAKKDFQKERGADVSKKSGGKESKRGEIENSKDSGGGSKNYCSRYTSQAIRGCRIGISSLRVKQWKEEGPVGKSREKKKA